MLSESHSQVWPQHPPVALIDQRSKSTLWKQPILIFCLKKTCLYLGSTTSWSLEGEIFNYTLLAKDIQNTILLYNTTAIIVQSNIKIIRWWLGEWQGLSNNQTRACLISILNLNFLWILCLIKKKILISSTYPWMNLVFLPCVAASPLKSYFFSFATLNVI